MASVLWFRRDLRTADHPALVDAGAADGAVVGLFVLDPRIIRSAGANRLAFLYGCLRALDSSLGGRLVVRWGRPEQVVPEVARSTGASEVHVTADFGPYGRHRDRRVRDALRGAGVDLVATDAPYAVPPGTICREGRGYRVFTPFYRAWKAHAWAAPLAPAEVDWQVPRGDLDAVPDDPPIAATLPTAGEAAAQERLEAFLRDGVASYADDRDRPALDRTSHLSPYLKYGCIHPRQILDRLGTGSGDERFRTELAWREFYADVLWWHPGSVEESLQAPMRSIAWDDGPEADRRFEAWRDGRTGYPIVDAGMRQLRAEGWMPNRVRMIAASFLVKDLHIDWRRGARHFLDELVDGDVASNAHGWQWVAGAGTDPAPFVRVFNPVRQGRAVDPTGDYVRRWVPEIRRVPDDTVHAPWEAGLAAPNGYPAPIVDHAQERREALARYDAARRAGASGG